MSHNDSVMNLEASWGRSFTSLKGDFCYNEYGIFQGTDL